MKLMRYQYKTKENQSRRLTCSSASLQRVRKGPKKGKRAEKPSSQTQACFEGKLSWSTPTARQRMHPHRLSTHASQSTSSPTARRRRLHICLFLPAHTCFSTYVVGDSCPCQTT
ncbi:hypothetical protein BC830DRAFT_1148906 [Chytriomyces sp. MP71]|nr:hypothetical protein BC830DRAFT_1148906 [Chytriomyces sp. MP71]